MDSYEIAIMVLYASLSFVKNRLSHCPYLISSNFIKTTNDISLDSCISFLPFGFSPRAHCPVLLVALL